MKLSNRRVPALAAMTLVTALSLTACGGDDGGSGGEGGGGESAGAGVTSAASDRTGAAMVCAVASKTVKNKVIWVRPQAR